jgi:hypothetical protein
MKNIFLTLSIFTLLISCSSDDSSDTPPTNNNVVQETFGNWSPDFTSQTANFTQTRTGTQGTQQTRTIVVTITSSTATSTEEILEEDINEDEDLFDEVEITTSNYSASEGLGSFQLQEINILTDYNNGIKIGDEFISLNFGYVEYDGDAFFCNTENEFTYFLLGLNSIGTTFSDNNFYGNGDLVELTFLIKSSELSNKFGLNSNYEYNISNFLSEINSYYGTSLSSVDEYEEWWDNYFEDTDGDGWRDADELLNNGNPDDPNITPDYDNYIEPTFCNGTSSNTNFIGLHTGSELYKITGGEYDNGTFFYDTSSFKINLSDSNTYSVIIEGETETGLPINIFYKGFLSKYDDRESKSGKKTKRTILKN